MIWKLKIWIKNFWFNNIYCPLFFCSVATSIKNLIKKIKSPRSMDNNFRVIVNFILWRMRITKLVSFVLMRKIKISNHDDYIWITSEKI